MASNACVTVIGAGLAGMSAALSLVEHGQTVRLVSAQTSQRAQSVLAEGGINAALDIMGEHDTVQEHYMDTMRGGVSLADPNAVWGLVNDAPAIVRRLLELGVPFQRDHGKMIQRNFGGQKKKRTAYARSSTGKVLVSALVDALRRFEALGMVERLAHHELVSLGIVDGVCGGVAVSDRFTGAVLQLEGPVVLACGGMGGLFGGLTTGTTTNTGDVAALAFAHGVELGNLEFVQYHPTTIPISGKRLLVSEAARGEGGRLYALRNGSPWYFMEEKYPELGNLMPRDVVSREEYGVLQDPSCGGQIYLDLRGLSKSIWRTRLSDMREEIQHYLSIDPAREPVPVEPGIHYCMGGLLVDEGHRTSVDGLFAAGECACAYHGANRLGGNSLLGAIRGGMVAGRTAAEDMLVRSFASHGDLHGVEAPQVKNSPEAEGAMQDILVRHMGIVRDGDDLRRGLDELEALPRTARVVLAEALLRSAFERTESRGAHVRSDYPQPSADLRKMTVSRFANDSVHICFREIPEAREEVPRA